MALGVAIGPSITGRDMTRTSVPAVTESAPAGTVRERPAPAPRDVAESKVETRVRELGSRSALLSRPVAAHAPRPSGQTTTQLLRRALTPVPSGPTAPTAQAKRVRFERDGMIVSGAAAPRRPVKPAAVIAVLVLRGQVLECARAGRTSNAIRNLLAPAPKTARRIEPDGVERDVPLEQIQVNDRLRVCPGERVPVDGLVIEGTTTIDIGGHRRADPGREAVREQGQGRPRPHPHVSSSGCRSGSPSARASVRRRVAVVAPRGRPR